MNKTDKIIVSFYVLLLMSFSIGMYHTNSTLGNFTLPDLTPHTVAFIQVSQNTDIDQTTIFNLMADIEKYPQILPKNVISVQIINHTENIIYAQEIISEQGIKTSLLVKHVLIPYDLHTIEIISGDAKNTVIKQKFETINSTTKVTTDVQLELKGLLSPFAYLPKSNLEHAIETVDQAFFEYGKKKTQNEQIIDSLYREILQRPIDDDGLRYWGTLLENKTLTVEQIRTRILESDEAHVVLEQQLKPLNEISIETKHTIDSLYREILQRPVDDDGLRYWGTLLENKTLTVEQIRTRILESDEAHVVLEQQLKPLNEISIETKHTIDSLYREILQRPVDDDGLRYWGTKIDSGTITKDELRRSLLYSEESIDKRRFNESSNIIVSLYEEILQRKPSSTELSHYKILLDTEEITIEKIKQDLNDYKNIQNSTKN